MRNVTTSLNIFASIVVMVFAPLHANGQAEAPWPARLSTTNVLMPDSASPKSLMVFAPCQPLAGELLAVIEFRAAPENASDPNGWAHVEIKEGHCQGVRGWVRTGYLVSPR